MSKKKNPNMALNAYVEKVYSAAMEEDGETLASLLSLKSDELSDQVLQLDSDFLGACCRRLESPWSEICYGHLKVASAFRSNDPIEAFTEQTSMAQQFHQAATSFPRTLLPVLYTIILDLRMLAIQADVKLSELGQKANSLEECARVMNKSFSICATDRFSSIDRNLLSGGFNLTFVIILKQINLAGNLIKSLRSADLPELEKFPIGHVVTFKYYMGVLAFYNEQYAKADEELTFAIRHCRAYGPAPELYKRNRRFRGFSFPGLT
ncbi:COP9 signalosome (CSN) subunit [Dinochytrium kinnereticum]|nr:COP9 signalosome (CSN) subunit [Dinochytrium kinnereticum]